ncbi:type I 3-dehydroquinase-domain-containing protein [Ilyonectria robusta]|uniref:type I 3-dehydroquinase-domain-containing protein n=1 Tax=Ilyonectria robusta TaxID=1079257 RepID=UPI001E8E6F81|nr:type I 3-dehydroquinase-domain-containing protein [Ilyonectria robusta]KAH8661154.1 type I 3-dehydroquinase-domain-containing protein [Ilyonectria robusta]
MGDIVFENHHREPRRQTFIIPLTYSDISLGATEIQRISYGGDIWEMRVDLLSPSMEPLGSSNLPPLHMFGTKFNYFSGGKFPDTAEEEALALMLMAVEEGCHYMDVEIEWSRGLIDTLVAKKRNTKLVASFHGWTGEIRWTSDTLQEKYALADTFGDIIKLSILSVDVYDCHELALFVKKHLAESPKPLLAVGMGQHGQLSRVLSPISLVTHKLLPAPSAPGQLTLAEVHTAQHLVGQLPSREYAVVGPEQSGEIVGSILQAGFREIGLPHSCNFLRDGKVFPQAIQKPKFGGAATASFTGFNRQDFPGDISEDAQSIGSVDTILLKHPNTASKPALTCGYVGDDPVAVRSACLAAEKIGYKTVQLLESNLIQSVAADFPGLDFASQKSQPSLVICCTKSAEYSSKHVLSRLLSDSPAGVLVDFSEESVSAKVVSANPGWKVVGKRELLATRACLLFSAWTGRRAPEVVMREVA